VTITTIGYFADGPWSHEALAKLLADETIRIAFVCARFDRPDPVLRARALEAEIEFLTHSNINSDEFIDTLAPFRCDLFVSMSFNQIFRRRIRELPPLGTINCHAGKLPFYRGRNILNWALINDEKEFGITVHYVDAGIDTGDILSQRTYPIADSDTYATLLDRAYPACAELLFETVKNIQSGRVAARPQREIHPQGLYCTARTSGDERMAWDQRSREVFNFVRAICRPGPEARTMLRGSEIRINRVELVPDAPIYKGIPGAVLHRDLTGFLVKTADSLVKVVEWTGIDAPRVGDRFA
jgi:methionyl-tRNA formyltransferase